MVKAESTLFPGWVTPRRLRSFQRQRRGGEFRIELQNMYPLGNPDNANVQIEELTWWRPLALFRRGVTLLSRVGNNPHWQ
jgi:hypothetical protein